MDKKQLSDFPKVDLHRHLDGSVKPALMIKLAKKFGVKLPTYSLDEFSRMYTINPEDDRPMPTDELFKRFAWTIAVMRTPEGLREVAYNQVLDLAEENIFYAELRFAPGYLSKYPAPFYNPKGYEQESFPVMSLDEVVDNVLSGIAKGMEETGIYVNLTLCIPRECNESYGIISAYEIAKLAMKYQGSGVTAIDLACDEFNYAPGPYADVFQRTVGSKIRRTPHAGEMGDDEYRLQNIRVCVKDLIANGLGHAIPLWKDKELVDLVKFLKIRVERNPWENPAIRGVGDDGTDYLLKEGILISLSSDDPVLMRKSLTDNLVKVVDEYNWTDREVNKIILNAVNSGFYRSPEQEKEVKKLFESKGLMI